MSAINRRVKAKNPSTKLIEEGVIISESNFRKTYDIKFSNGVYKIHKNGVQFLPA